ALSPLNSRDNTTNTTTLAKKPAANSITPPPRQSFPTFRVSSPLPRCIPTTEGPKPQAAGRSWFCCVSAIAHPTPPVSPDAGRLAGPPLHQERPGTPARAVPVFGHFPPAVALASFPQASAAGRNCQRVAKILRAATRGRAGGSHLREDAGACGGSF